MTRRARQRSRFALPPPAPLPDNVYWIESDTYDRAVYQRLSVDAPSLRALIESGAKLVPHFGALLRDLFCGLFKCNVVFLSEDAVRPSAALNRRLLTTLHAGELARLLREATVLDEERAGLASVLLGEGVLRLLKSEKPLTRRDLLDAWDIENQERLVDERIEQARHATELVEQTARASSAPPLSPAAKARLGQAAERLAGQARAEATRLQHRARRFEQDLSRVHGETAARFLKEAIDVVRQLDAAAQQTQAWDEAVGGHHQSSPARQLELGKRLAGNPKLEKLAALVGHMKPHALALRRKVFERSAEEVFEVGTGAELSRLLPHELLSWQHPVLRKDFMRRLVDHELLQYDLRGLEEKGKGPVVICLDGSSSMQGDKEIWAKALTLTLLEIARRQRRRCRSICFASTTTPLHIVDLNTQRPFAPEPNKLLDVAEYFPGGGTDFEKPLDAALACIQESRFRRADIVFITDGECQVHADWLDRFAVEKEAHGFSVFSILIDVSSRSARSRDALSAFSDTVTSVSQLTSDEASEIFVRV